jgi:DNA-binding CsgD family transcriptional regulator
MGQHWFLLSAVISFSLGGLSLAVIGLVWLRDREGADGLYLLAMLALAGVAALFTINFYLIQFLGRPRLDFVFARSPALLMLLSAAATAFAALGPMGMMGPSREKVRLDGGPIGANGRLGPRRLGGRRTVGALGLAWLAVMGLGWIVGGISGRLPETALLTARLSGVGVAAGLSCSAAMAWRRGRRGRRGPAGSLQTIARCLPVFAPLAGAVAVLEFLGWLGPFSNAHLTVAPWLFAVWCVVNAVVYGRRLAARPAAVGAAATAPDWEMIAGRLGLTPREREIAQLIYAGLADKEIAQSLSLKTKTVQNNVYGLYRKLGINSRFALMELVRRET